MSNKTRSLIKGIALVIVALCVLTHMDIFTVKQIAQYKFWLMVIAFGMTLLVSK